MKLKERIARITDRVSTPSPDERLRGLDADEERRNRRAAMEATVRHHVRELVAMDAAEEARSRTRRPAPGLRTHVAAADPTGTIQQRSRRGIQIVESWGESREGGFVYAVVTSDGRGACAHAETAIAATRAVIDALGAEEFAFLLVAPERT